MIQELLAMFLGKHHWAAPSHCSHLLQRLFPWYQLVQGAQSHQAKNCFYLIWSWNICFIPWGWVGFHRICCHQGSQHCSHSYPKHFADQPHPNQSWSHCGKPKTYSRFDSEFLTSTVLTLAATCTYIRSICKCMCSTFIDFSKDFKEELNFRQFDWVRGRTVIVETHLFSLTFWSKGHMTLISALKIDSIPAVRKCQLQVKL